MAFKIYLQCPAHKDVMLNLDAWDGETVMMNPLIRQLFYSARCGCRLMSAVHPDALNQNDIHEIRTVFPNIQILKAKAGN